MIERERQRVRETERDREGERDSPSPPLQNISHENQRQEARVE